MRCSHFFLCSRMSFLAALLLFVGILIPAAVGGAPAFIDDIDVPEQVPPAADSWVSSPTRAAELFKAARASLRPEDALQLVEQAIGADAETDPAERQYYSFRGDCKKMLGEHGPSQATTHYNAAKRAAAEGDYQRARRLYDEALVSDPFFLWAANNRAWIEATHPDEKARDGRDAIRYALYACIKSEWHNWSFIDTLGAAYAEIQDFATAERCAERALELVPPASSTVVRESIVAYRSKSPRRDKKVVVLPARETVSVVGPTPSDVESSHARGPETAIGVATADKGSVVHSLPVRREELAGLLGARLELFTRDGSGLGPPSGHIFSRLYEDGVAAELGLRRGDILVKVGDIRFPSLEQFRDLLSTLDAPHASLKVQYRRSRGSDDAFTRRDGEPSTGVHDSRQTDRQSELISEFLHHSYGPSQYLEITGQQLASAVERVKRKRDAEIRRQQWERRQPLTLTDGSVVTRDQIRQHNESLVKKNSAAVIEQLSESGPELARDMELTALVMSALEDAMKKGEYSGVCEIMEETTKNGLAGKVGNVLRSTGADKRYYEMPGNRVLTGGELWEKAAEIFVRSHTK